MQIVKKYTKLLIFISIILFLFCHVTYLYAEVNDNRYRIIGIKEGAYDIVYIGGSDVHNYWQPLRAWQDKGWYSYNYSSDALPFENIKECINESQKYQNPKLYVIGMRTLTNLELEQSEGSIRNWAGGMDVFSINRIKMIQNYLKYNEGVSIDKTSLYLSIFYYHSNNNILPSSDRWELIFNKGTPKFHGYSFNDTYQNYEEINKCNTDEVVDLTEKEQTALIDLLEYCKLNNINVLFVTSPYVVTVEDQKKKYNQAGEIIQEYGFKYLDCTFYDDQMGIDYATDFYDLNHTNCIGAEKYTTFLEDFIDENYSIYAHFDETDGASWDLELNEFLEVDRNSKANMKELTEDNSENTDNLP